MSNGLLALFGKRPACVLDRSILPEMFSRYLDLATQFTDAKPGLLLTAWLPYCAVNLGNRIYMVNNSNRIYPNIWSCVIGPSSVSRKSTALRYAGYTLAPHERGLATGPLADYEQQAMVLNGTTLAKLMSYLSLNPARLFVHNEISAWLYEMQKSYNAGYKQVVTEIFDNVDRTVANRERTERIIKPALSIAAASTEGWLYKNMLDGADQLSGFLQRMIFFVARNIGVDDIDLSTRGGEGLEDQLAAFDDLWFARWRAITGSHRLDLSPEAKDLREQVYEEDYRRYFARNNDTLMSYFTRLFDGYWFKFCALFQISEIPPTDLDHANFHDAYAELFAAHPISDLNAARAWDLCRFYMGNTTPLLDIMDEKDKLASERKLVDILLNKFGGKARHSDLMNRCHMRKREFHDTIESLIDREALTVETYKSTTNTGKMYVLNPGIVKDWGGAQTL